MKTRISLLQILILLFIFISCSEDNLETDLNNTEMSKMNNNSQLVDQAISSLNKTYRISISEENFIESQVIKSKDNNDYENYIFEHNQNYYTASYDLEGKKFAFNSRFENNSNNTRDITLNDLSYNEVITVNSMPIEGNCNDDETCAGCHYRVMKDIIYSNGDSAAACDLLDILGICSAQVYIAATIHCWIEH